MKVLGFVAEYNPFHKGHKYHLDKSKEKSAADFSIAVMSGSFLQRGQPSFIDKWTKAKMAVNNGIDLVIELPFIFSTQSAETFAYGAIKLLDSLNVVDYLSFGSELENIEVLKKISSILSEEPKFYKEKLKYYLDQGLSFPNARNNALEDYILNSKSSLDYDYKEILKGSNNILAIEYLKALSKLNSKISPISIKRIGNKYNDTSINGDFASATAIRHSIKNNGLASIKNLVPGETYSCLENYIDKYKSFNYTENYEDILIYLLRTVDADKIKGLIDIENGLENRIIEKGSQYNNINEIIDNIATKRYPKTRIQRILVHLLNGLYKKDFDELNDLYPSYIRVLASNDKGLSLLREIKNNSTLPIITKFSNYKYLNDDTINKIIYFDKKATDIFYLGLASEESLNDMDYYTSPYIK